MAKCTLYWLKNIDSKTLYKRTNINLKKFQVFFQEYYLKIIKIWGETNIMIANFFKYIYSFNLLVMLEMFFSGVFCD